MGVGWGQTARLSALRLALPLQVALCVAALAQVPVVNTTDQRIAAYEQWVAADPANTSNQTLLAAAYIQKTRESTDFGYLDRADKIVTRILADHRDYEALRLRNLIELNRHHFAKVAEYARELTRSAPRDPQNWGTLGDALMEMGQYDKAVEAYRTMLDIRPNLFSYNRMAYYRFVTGDIDGALSMMSQAVESSARFPENMAWCLVELGHMYFKTGRWDEAEDAYRKAIETFPSAHAAHAGLASVKAAKGEIHEAIDGYKKAQSITPLVQYTAALYDLYELSGNKPEAKRQADTIDLVAKLERAANQKANRTLALVYANQDRNLAYSLELAQADFEVRGDVYTLDALAWALYKNGRLEEARKASSEALKTGAPEAVFHYHTGMIARALGDEALSTAELKKALQLNPAFDVRQAAIARAILENRDHL